MKKIEFQNDLHDEILRKETHKYNTRHYEFFQDFHTDETDMINDMARYENICATCLDKSDYEFFKSALKKMGGNYKIRTFNKRKD